jgi:hypothetical protein
MFANRVLGSIVLMLWAVTLCACSGHGGLAREAPAGTGSPQASGPAGIAGVPGLTGLPAPERTLSVIGPGWAQIEPQETVSRDNAAVGPGDRLSLNAVGGMAYAVYGVAGFDGDNGPTSARVTQDSITGQYFVGFSDYVAGEWRFAGPFTGNATVEIPLPDSDPTNAYTSPHAFTSTAGTCYFVVAVPEGDQLRITGVELGVQGGTLGPMRPFFDYIGGGANGCVVIWTPSPSSNDPDFAGYVLERAPLLWGDFAPLVAGVITNHYYVDATAVLDVTYRYRLAAVDASGNQSVWSTSSGGCVTGGLANPVAVLKVPRGPLHSPANVTLDMSASIDPEGVGIVNYDFSFFLYPQPLSGVSSTQTPTLPPGCHYITGTVTTGDGRTQSTTALLKVYPTWANTPTVVAPADPAATLSRLTKLRGVLQPGTTRPVLFGADHTSYSCAFWYEDAAHDFIPSRLPLINPTINLSEAKIAHGDVYVVTSDSNVYTIARFHDGEGEWIPPSVSVQGGVTASALAVDPAEKLYLFVVQNAAIDLTAFDLDNPGTPYVVVPAIGGMISIDAEYNPGANVIDIVYSTAATTEWVRWDPVAHAVVDSANISVAPSARIDIEPQPVNGRPSMIYFDVIAARWVYTALDAGMTWIAGEIVDVTGVNSTSGDLAYGDSGHAFAYFATAPGSQSNLHERTGVGTWAPRNTPAYAGAAGLDVVLLNLPGTDDFLAADRIAGNHVIIGNLTDTPSESIVFDLAPYRAQMGNIQGAAGTTDTTANGPEMLHVMFTDMMTSSGNHYTSTNGGASWAPEAATAYEDFDMGATLDGGVYVTNHVPANHQLYFWDPVASAFAAYALAPIGGPQYSFLIAGLASSDVTWISYDGAANLTYIVGHFGVAPVATVSPAGLNPVWTGAGDMAGFSTIYGVLAGGANINASQLQWGPNNTGGLNFISDALFAETATVYDEVAVRTKQTAATSFLSRDNSLGLMLPEMALWTTWGPLLDAERCKISLASGTVTTALPLNTNSVYEDLRRTATAACGAGWTGIGLVSTFDGANTYFEWSNYGDWERLDLPPALHDASNPELIVGRDGNWHIVYWDWLTDRVLCLSSL